MTTTARASGAAPGRPTESKKSNAGSGSARLRQLLLLGLAFAMVVGGAAYWRYLELYPSTDDAFVTANIVKIAPQVSGEAKRVYFDTNQLVRQGDPLFDIDSARHDIEVENAHTRFDAASAAAGGAGKSVLKAADAIVESRKDVNGARNAFFDVRERIGTGSADAYQLDEKADAVKKAEAEFQVALDNLGSEIEKLGKGNRQLTELRLAATAVQRAELERALTRISAPISGWVSGGNLVAGALVQQGRPAFSIIGREGWWVDAHFKETDLGRIRPGQKVSIKVDMYPDVELKGNVGSISAGSGATFSLLPPENATGNWVKVSQRFTVRVNLTELPNQSVTPLRVGASANVKVDTADGAGFMSAIAGTAK